MEKFGSHRIFGHRITVLEGIPNAWWYIGVKVANFTLQFTAIFQKILGEGPYTVDEDYQDKKYDWGDSDNAERIEAKVVDFYPKALWSADTYPLEAENFSITENGTENWGKRIRITFNRGLTNIEGVDGHFILLDEDGFIYIAKGAEEGEQHTTKPGLFDGSRELILETEDFNKADEAGSELTIEYFGGEDRLQGEIGQDVDSFDLTFTPDNLDPAIVPDRPEVEEIFNG